MQTKTKLVHAYGLSGHAGLEWICLDGRAAISRLVKTLIALLGDPSRGDEQFCHPLLEAARRRKIEAVYLTSRDNVPENADLYVTAHPEYAYEWRKLVNRTVILFHGLSEEERGGFCCTRSFFSNRIGIPTRLWRGWLVPGEEFAKGYPRYLRNNVKVVGFPKLDLYFSENRKEMMEVLRKQCDLKLPYMNTVLYAPTFWLPHSRARERIIQDSAKIAKQLVDASQSMDFNLIIKAHPNTGKGGYGLELLRLMDKCRRLPGINCLIPPGKIYRSTVWLGNIVPLFWFSDVLVSDYSSTLREFMITNRPSVQVLSPLYRPLAGMYQTRMNQLKETLSKAFNGIADPYEERTLQVRRYMYKADGHSSDRAIDALLELRDDGATYRFFYSLISRIIECARARFGSQLIMSGRRRASERDKLYLRDALPEK